MTNTRHLSSTASRHFGNINPLIFILTQVITATVVTFILCRRKLRHKEESALWGLDSGIWTPVWACCSRVVLLSTRRYVLLSLTAAKKSPCSTQTPTSSRPVMRNWERTGFHLHKEVRHRESQVNRISFEIYKILKESACLPWESRCQIH